MYYSLKPQYILRGWQKAPYALIDQEKHITLFLTGDVFDVLRLCDGKIDFSMPFLISGQQRAIAEQLFSKGIVDRSDVPGAVSSRQEYFQYPSRFIKQAHWSITGKCNYRCRHCYMSAEDAKLGELPFETVMKIIDELDKCGVGMVSLTGGEPLVRKDFWDIVDALLEKNIMIESIYSNGALVNDRFLDGLEKRGLGSCTIDMSYDGPGFHDWLRGIDGAEKLVDAAFLRCKERGIQTRAEMCLCERNKHLLRASVNHLAEAGCSRLKVNGISNLGKWKENGYGTSIPIPDLYRTYLDYIPHFYEDGAPLNLQLGGFFVGNKGDLSYYSIPRNREGQDPEKVCLCSHARTVMYISPEGRALPCFSLSGMNVQQKFPVIQDIGLVRCLNDSFFMDFVQKKAVEIIRHNEQCRGCEYRNICLGGCRAEALSLNENGFLDKDPNACEFYRGGWYDKLTETVKKIIH